MKIKLLILLCALILTPFSFTVTKKINITFFQKNQFFSFTKLSFPKEKPYLCSIEQDVDQNSFGEIRNNIIECLYENKVYNPALGNIKVFEDWDSKFQIEWNNLRYRANIEKISGFIVVQTIN